jgi:hypothetical protein
VIGVATGHYDVGALNKAGADAVFPTLQDNVAVIAAIKQLAGMS